MMDRLVLKFVAIFVAVVAFNALALADDIQLGIYQEDPHVQDHRGEIGGLIKAQIDIIKQNDPSTISDAREWIVTNASEARQANGKATHAGIAFMDLYTTELNKLLLPLTTPDQPIRVRLNAAIIEFKVCSDAPNTNLLPSVISSLHPDNAAPVYWAEQAAGLILQNGINQVEFANDRDKLLNAMVDGAIPFGQSFGVSDPLSGQIIKTAYDALNCNVTGILNNKDHAKSVVKAVVTALLKLKQSRLKIYIAHNEAPSQPLMDTYALIYVEDQQIWSLMDADLQQQVVQSASDLIQLAAKQVEDLQAHQQVRNGTGGATITDLMDTINHEAWNLKSLATNMIKNSDMAAAVEKVYELSKIASATEIEAAVTPLIPALQKKFPTLHPPEGYSSKVK